MTAKIADDLASPVAHHDRSLQIQSFDPEGWLALRIMSIN
jgi:hypothetical protein